MGTVQLALAPDTVRIDLTAETAARIAADNLIIASGAMPANVGIAPVIATGSTALRTVADRFADTLNVLDFGAAGDGVTDDTAAIQAAVDAAFGPASSPHGTSCTLNRPLFFPAGDYLITSPILFYGVQGGHVYGAGRKTTRIYNAAGGNVFNVNGFGYGKIELLSLETSGATATCLNLDWDHVAPVSTQQVTLADLFIYKPVSGAGTGIAIGASGHQCSEVLIQNCAVSAIGGTGLAILNYNALGITVVGGNYQGCDIAIDITAGAASQIAAVGFQMSDSWDIRIQNAAGDAYCITSCRSESVNFLYNQVDCPVVLIGCSHLNANPGIFVQNDAVMIGCVSLSGTSYFGQRSVRIRSIGDLTVGSGGTTTASSYDFTSNRVFAEYLDTVGNATVSIASMRYGLLIRRGTQTAPFTDTLPTRADLLAAVDVGGLSLGDTSAGTNWRFRIINTTTQAQTLASSDADLTLVGDMTIAAGGSKDFLLVNDTTTSSIYG